MKKAMIRIPLVYSTFACADINIESIQSVLAIFDGKNEKSQTYIKTTHGNFDTNLLKEQVTRAIDIATRRLEGGEEGYIVVRAADQPDD